MDWSVYFEKQPKKRDVKQQGWNQANMSQSKMVEDFISTGVKHPLGAKPKNTICSNSNL